MSHKFDLYIVDTAHAYEPLLCMCALPPKLSQQSPADVVRLISVSQVPSSLKFDLIASELFFVIASIRRHQLEDHLSLKYSLQAITCEFQHAGCDARFIHKD